MLPLLVLGAVEHALTGPAEIGQVGNKEVTPGGKALLAVDLSAFVIAQRPQGFECGIAVSFFCRFSRMDLLMLLIMLLMVFRRHRSNKLAETEVKTIAFAQLYFAVSTKGQGQLIKGGVR